MIEPPLRDGLPPVVGPHPRVLLLGSFPSELSLAAGEYYANPRNQFWPLLGAVFGFDAAVAYPQRIAAAAHHGVALWDVIGRCRRTGSLDARIDRKSVQRNDVDALLAEHPGIRRMLVNGAAAHDLAVRHLGTALPVLRLPSSSPAATTAFAVKLARWRELLVP